MVMDIINEEETSFLKILTCGRDQEVTIFFIFDFSWFNFFFLFICSLKARVQKKIARIL